MCEPVTIGLAIASAVGAMSGVAAQKAQGKAQRRSLEEQRRVQAEELSQQAEEQIGTRIRAARRERARATVAAGESGIGGNSFTAQLQDSLTQQGMDTAIIAKNLRIKDRASQANFTGAVNQTANPGPLDFLSAGISGASSGLQIGGQIDALRPPH